MTTRNLSAMGTVTNRAAAAVEYGVAAPLICVAIILGATDLCSSLNTP